MRAPILDRSLCFFHAERKVQYSRKLVELSIPSSVDRRTARFLGLVCSATEEEADPTRQPSDPKPFTWTRSPDQVLESVKNHCERISDQGTSKEHRQVSALSPPSD